MPIAGSISFPRNCTLLRPSCACSHVEMKLDTGRGCVLLWKKIHETESLAWHLAIAAETQERW